MDDGGVKGGDIVFTGKAQLMFWTTSHRNFKWLVSSKISQMPSYYPPGSLGALRAQLIVRGPSDRLISSFTPLGHVSVAHTGNQSGCNLSQTLVAVAANK